VRRLLALLLLTGCLPTQDPPVYGSVVVLGDSITYGLRNHLPAEFGPGTIVDATGGDATTDHLEDLYGQSNPDIGIVNLGSNDTRLAALGYSDISDLVPQYQQIRANLDPTCEVLVTLSPVDWSSQPVLRAAHVVVFNAWLINQADADTVVLDWATASEGHPEWFVTGTPHLTAPGKAVFMGLLVEAVGSCPAC
jgi:hypothetical protein